MTITTFDQFIGAAKQDISISKSASRGSVAASWFSVIDVAGNPGAGVLAGASVAAGVVPTDGVAGFPVINSFGSGNVGYLARVDFGSSVACRLALSDLLFKAGAYPFNAAQALSGQPSYAARVPGGDFSNTEIWLEAVTAGTGNQTVAVTYTNQDGVAGRSTGAVNLGVVLSVGRMFQLPLQAGDTGVRTIESVTGTVATAGTFNILVLRPLWNGRCRIANDGDVHDLAKTGMPVVFDNSALFLQVAADSTATGIPEIFMTIANG